MHKEPKTKVFAIRMQPSVFAAGEILAARANRSLASYMETLLREQAEAAGLWPPPDETAVKATTKGKKK